MNATVDELIVISNTMGSIYPSSFSCLPEHAEHQLHSDHYESYKSDYPHDPTDLHNDQPAYKTDGIPSA